ncbi:hypothetical protein [Amycolatopsis sp.]|jgi:hypothetical protein|uniref:hypothetical protein n=1 Tax=Amycolatopsis sp. TaxID=37632 RepID=UPI002E0BF5E8|nr:hypothetical protein [Amycolatopsis sp.]
MSATGDFDNDGTHAPIPQDRFADPLSGLVTASDAAPTVSEEFERLRIADPVQPDPDMVREMVNAAALADNADYDRPVQPAAFPQQANGASVTPGQPPLGIIPQQRTWPARPPQMLRQARSRWPRPRRGVKNAEDAPRTKQRAPRDRIRRGKPSSNSAGVILAVVLMIVFAVLFIQLLASLFSGIAGIFS